MPKLHAVYEKDEAGYWVATVTDIRGCHTQGRSIDEARRRVREAVSLFRDDADTVEIADDVRLPASAKSLIVKYHEERQRAAVAEKRARITARQAAGKLTRGLHFSARDAAFVLGLSHQRVHQLTSGASDRPSPGKK